MPRITNQQNAADDVRSSIALRYKSVDPTYSPKDSASQTYTLELINNSARDWVFYVYQKQEKQSAKMLSLAWFASPYPIAKDDSITFEWSIDYTFVWGDTGIVKPGIIYKAKGGKSAHPTEANATTFGYNAAGSPTLTAPTLDTNNKGSLVIKNLGNIPDQQFSVGIGMSGQGTFVEQAGPNLTQIFSPTPQYWIGAANSIKIGEILEIQTLTNTQNASFPTNVFNLKYSLNSLHKWDQQ